MTIRSLMAVRAALWLLFLACCLLSLSQLELTAVSIDAPATYPNTPTPCFTLSVFDLPDFTILSSQGDSTSCVGRSALLLILLVCGDIQMNPGPECVQDSCSVCGSLVRNDEDGLLCEVCLNWSHRSCASMSLSEYYHWSVIEDGWI